MLSVQLEGLLHKGLSWWLAVHAFGQRLRGGVGEEDGRGLRCGLDGQVG